MKGIILAAGKGTRLYPITRHIPKPLLPIGNRPTIHYAFERLIEIGVRDICIVVGQNEPAMREALGDGAEFEIKLSYVRQSEPKGLAHAVSFAEAFVDREPFALYLGDAIYSEGFGEFAERFANSGCANLNLVKPVEDPSRFGVAETTDGKITKLVEKPREPRSNLAMAGLYFFGPQIWDVLPGLAPSGRGEYEITDAIQLLIDRGDTVLAGEYYGHWFDTGTLTSYLETSAFLSGRERVMGTGATLHGEMGAHVVLGDGAFVECESIEDCVVMPGSRVIVRGAIREAILAGEVHSNGDLVRVIRYNDEEK